MRNRILIVIVVLVMLLCVVGLFVVEHEDELPLLGKNETETEAENEVTDSAQKQPVVQLADAIAKGSLSVDQEQPLTTETTKPQKTDDDWHLHGQLVTKFDVDYAPLRDFSAQGLFIEFACVNRHSDFYENFSDPVPLEADAHLHLTS
ncbi:MAG: hypothetical protein V3V10_07150 [Planctomycetota bacterium]